MKKVYGKILELAEPYLKQPPLRKNLIHTKICLGFMEKLIEIEGGDDSILIPTIILHDIGWFNVPKSIISTAWKQSLSKRKEIWKIHEREGVKIAEKILKEVNYPKDKTKKILHIISIHDEPEKIETKEEKLVNDADVLWRLSKIGFWTDVKRFNVSPKDRLKQMSKLLRERFFTKSGKILAKKLLNERKAEVMN